MRNEAREQKKKLEALKAAAKAKAQQDASQALKLANKNERAKKPAAENEKITILKSTTRKHSPEQFNDAFEQVKQAAEMPDQRLTTTHDNV